MITDVLFDDCRVKRVTRFVRKLRGGAQSSLVVANDGGQYALKFTDNPQGKNLLFNEALGSELYRMLGLPTADWAPIYVDNELLSENKWAWFELKSGKCRPRPGVHFGSKIIEDPLSATYEVIPRSWFPRIQKRDQFWGALVVDAWSEHADNRQAIFTKNPLDLTLKATFFDHGHMFRGANGNDEFKFVRPMFLDRTIYEADRAQDALEEWIVKIQTLSSRTIHQALAAVPTQWQEESTSAVCDRLLLRRQQIEGIVYEEMKQLPRRRASYQLIGRDRQISAIQCGMFAIQ